jgi:hypothetical protein
VAQQAFSSDAGSTLHLAIPALETLHKAWSTRADRPKYAHFATALTAAAQKIDEYYERTTTSAAYIMAMCQLFSATHSQLLLMLIHLQYLIQLARWLISRRTGLCIYMQIS